MFVAPVLALMRARVQKGGKKPDPASVLALLCAAVTAQPGRQLKKREVEFALTVSVVTWLHGPSRTCWWWEHVAGECLHLMADRK